MKLSVYEYKKTGFSIIELLVVVSIIALISSVILSAVVSARMKARDSARISNAHNLKLALEQYVASQNSYYVLGAGENSNGSGYVAKSGLPNYTTSIITKLKSASLYSSDKLEDPVFGTDNYYLGVCPGGAHYNLYLKVEQESLAQPSSTVQLGCDGASAVSKNFNYAVEFGGTPSGGGQASAASFGNVAEYKLSSENYISHILAIGQTKWIIDVSSSKLTKVLPDGTFMAVTTPVDVEAFTAEGENLWFTHPNGIGKITGSGEISLCPVYTDKYLTDIYYGGGSLWVLVSRDVGETATIYKVDTLCNIQETISVPEAYSNSPAIFYDGTNIWTTQVYTYIKITPDRQKLRYSVFGSGQMVFDGQNIWSALNSSGGGVSRVSLDGTVNIFGNENSVISHAVEFDGTNVWSANDNGTITKYELNGDHTSFQLNTENNLDISYDGVDSLWVLGRIGSGSEQQAVVTKYKIK